MDLLMLLLVICIAVLLLDALSCVGDNQLLQFPPVVWTLKIVRWVKIRWYTWRYHRADKRVKYHIAQCDRPGKQLTHFCKFNVTVVHRSRMYQRLRDVTDAK